MNAFDPDENDDLDANELLESEDTLEDRGVVDALDEGYSPPERSWVGDDFGNTANEAAEGESIEGRLARELPEVAEDEGDGLGDSSDTDGELFDDEVGTERAGRLVATGGDFDDDEELYAEDAGIDGAGASAEEAAVHIIAERDEDEDDDR
ncbi:DUF5709 domain-containing protein [Pseudonocardia sp. GCM10023141]|uniref:DUF5709 domain-containing protein n=1 Tax=Pseudonocardia sp. GCM10023141 TaxID=3252653 RepID=UPI00360BF5D5